MQGYSSTTSEYHYIFHIWQLIWWWTGMEHTYSGGTSVSQQYLWVGTFNITHEHKFWQCWHKNGSCSNFTTYLGQSIAWERASKHKAAFKIYILEFEAVFTVTFTGLHNRSSFKNASQTNAKVKVGFSIHQ